MQVWIAHLDKILQRQEMVREELGMYNLTEQGGARTMIILGEQECCVMETRGRESDEKRWVDIWCKLRECFIVWVEGRI